MVVDTELIRVNFVRERRASHGRAQARGENGDSLAVQRLHPIVILAPAPGVTFVASRRRILILLSVSPSGHPCTHVAQAHFGPVPLSPHQRLGVT